MRCGPLLGFGLGWIAILVVACGESREKSAPLPDPSEDPCRDAFRSDAGANDACVGACAPDAGCARPPDEQCDEADEEYTYNLCIWTDEADLERILAKPEERVEVPASVSLAGRTYQAVELELHGGTARTFSKKSYRLRFAETRPDFDFFGDGSERVERLVLQAAWIDPTFVRAKLVFDTLRGLGALAPRVAYARVYINGELQGLYQVIERVDEHFLEGHGLSRDGNLYKAENHHANFGLHENPLDGFSERTHEDGEAEDLADLFGAVAHAEASLAAFESEIATRIHLPDFALWNQVMSYALNLDTFSKNYYLYHDPDAGSPERGQRFRLIHWDADTTFGLWWTGERHHSPEEAWLYGPRNVLSRRLYEIPGYRAAYVAEFEQLLTGALSADRLWMQADALLTALRPDIEADLAQWKRDTSYAEERAFLEETIFLREVVMGELLAEESMSLRSVSH